MAAALACLQELKRIDGYKIMADKGRKLLAGMVEISKAHGYSLKVTGAPAMPDRRITDDESLMLHQQWCGECIRRGAYLTSHYNWFISTAHTDEDIQRTLEIADHAFKAMKQLQ